MSYILHNINIDTYQFAGLLQRRDAQDSSFRRVACAELEFACLSGTCRLDWLPLPCIALIWPSQLSCLGSSVGRVSAS